MQVNSDPAENDFRFSPAASLRVHPIGKERRPVVVVDDFVMRPQSLLAHAGNGEGFHSNPHDYYPGVRKPVPQGYTAALCAEYGGVLREIFALAAQAEPSVILCAFSITTTEPSRLRPIQRVPHFDTSDPNQLALVHFLCQAQHGGTSFYRHAKTGYETISQDKLKAYAEILKREVMTEYALPAKYMDGDNPLFERIGGFDAQFNRALIYPSNLLHSGDIRQILPPHTHPSAARLTVNAFIKFG